MQSKLRNRIKKMRESTYINIPEQYKENEEKDLCRVCGKPKSEWKNGRRKYCSDDCWWKYQECFKTWTAIRKEVLKRDNNKCVLCGYNKVLEIDHIKAVVNGGEMWNYDNLRTLCKDCHNKKTGKDMKQRNFNKNINLMKEKGQTFLNE